jgi:hypothetical protein
MVEAMKMENVLRAERDGKVKQDLQHDRTVLDDEDAEGLGDGTKCDHGEVLYEA